MSTKAVTVRMDDSIKSQAEIILEDIGMNLTTFIISSLKALIRERKIPFEMVTTQYLNDHIILEKLSEAEREADDPNTQRLTHDEVFSNIRKKHGYEV